MCSYIVSSFFVMAFYLVRNFELSDIKRCAGIHGIGKDYLSKLKHRGIGSNVHVISNATAFHTKMFLTKQLLYRKMFKYHE